MTSGGRAYPANENFPAMIYPNPLQSREVRGAEYRPDHCGSRIQRRLRHAAVGRLRNREGEGRFETCPTSTSPDCLMKIGSSEVAERESVSGTARIMLVISTEKTIIRRAVLVAALLLFTDRDRRRRFRRGGRVSMVRCLLHDACHDYDGRYQEVHPLTHAGRIFNSFLILFGVSVMFFSVGAITQTIIELELHDHFGKRRTRRMIDRMDSHFIVCGYGRVGRNASLDLLRAGVPFAGDRQKRGEIENVMKAGMIGFLAD